MSRPRRAYAPLTTTALLTAIALAALPELAAQPAGLDWRPGKNKIPESHKQAARFLAQATFGPDPEAIEEVAESGVEAWLEHQLDLEPTLHLDFAGDLADEVDELFEDLLEDLGDEDRVETNLDEVFTELFFSARRFAWWQAALTAPDQLRQRVAFALSEIIRRLRPGRRARGQPLRAALLL